MGLRILYLVRHGHYHMEVGGAKSGKLTALGRRQAKRVGKRFASVDLYGVHHSDLLRISLTQGSVTVMAVGPTPARVTLMSFNDVGHLPPKMQTFL